MSGRRRDLRWAVLAAGGAVSVAASWQTPGSRLVFLQVGQSDCTLIQDRGWTVLIDAAGADAYVDLAQRLAIPELRRLGVHKIDAVILTHPDQDHIGGLPAIAGRWKIGAVYMPATFESHPAVAELQRRCPQLVWRWIDPGESLRFGGTRLTFDYMASNDDNEGSLATLVEMGASRAVLTGDAPAAAENWLAGRGDWSGEVMKVGHHGSGGSTSEAWLNEVRPRYAVISCGRSNLYRHPDPGMLSRMEAWGVRAFRTDWDGTTTFLPTPQGFQPVKR